MTKYLLLIGFSFTVAATHAQSLDDVQKNTILGKFPEAKVTIDKYMENPKNAGKPDGWYYKGFIYDNLSKDSTKSMADNAQMKDVAFEAIKKYRELDPKAKLLAEQNNSVLYDLYVGYFSDLGVKAYMAKDPAGAFSNFKKALDVHDYLVTNDLAGANNFKFSKLDTTLVLYTAIAANESKNPAEAIKYYKIISDAGIADPQYIDAYQFQADYYKTNKNHEAFTDIIDKGKKLYPANKEYWGAMEIEEATDGVEKPALFGKYDELMAKNPGNYTLLYNYSVELYRYIYDDNMKDSNTTVYKTKLVDVAKKAIAVKSTSEANFLLSNFLYNNSIDVAEEARKMKAVKPEDAKKKKEVQAMSDAQMNESVPYAEEVVKIYPTLDKPKTSEKINYKQALTILKNVAETKKDTAKAASYDKLIKEAQ